MTDRRVASSRPAGEAIELVSPSPGLFHARVAVGDVVGAGSVVGDLDVLGNTRALIAPEAAQGVVTSLRDPSSSRIAVDFGAVLLTIDPHGSKAGSSAQLAGPAASAVGLVFRAPTSGRYYGRAAPDKPPFITIGAELSAGTTVCLLEVMKTFHRVSYGGTGLPERARVRELLVADGADVSAGEPLLALGAC